MAANLDTHLAERLRNELVRLIERFERGHRSVVIPSRKNLPCVIDGLSCPALVSLTMQLFELLAELLESADDQVVGRGELGELLQRGFVIAAHKHLSCVPDGRLRLFQLLPCLLAFRARRDRTAADRDRFRALRIKSERIVGALHRAVQVARLETRAGSIDGSLKPDGIVRVPDRGCGARGAAAAGASRPAGPRRIQEQRLVDELRGASEIAAIQLLPSLVEQSIDFALFKHVAGALRQRLRLGLIWIQPRNLLAALEGRLSVPGFESAARFGKVLGDLPLPARFQHLALPGWHAAVGLRFGSRSDRLAVRIGLPLKASVVHTLVRSPASGADIGLPAQVAQLDRIASRQRLEVGREVIRRRHRRRPTSAGITRMCSSLRAVATSRRRKSFDASRRRHLSRGS